MSAMELLASQNTFLPEDDLSLTKAIENGASFQALAKGAVQFSRQFTIQELRDRWQALLFNQHVSEQALSYMIELELSSKNPSKFTRSGSSEAQSFVSGKRKIESVRNCYHALRKRICSESFKSMDLDFLIAPNDGEGPLADDFMPSDLVPNMLADGVPTDNRVVSSNNFCMGKQNSLREDFPLEHDYIPEIHEEKLPFTGKASSFGEPIQSTKFSACNMSNIDHSQTKPISTFHTIHSDLGNLSPELVGNQVFDSPVLDCNSSLHKLPCSSPPPEMPMYRNLEGFSSQTLPDDIGIINENLHPGDMSGSLNCGASKHLTTSGSNKHSDLMIEFETTCAENGSRSDCFAELNSLLNLTDEEEDLFMDEERREMIGKSYEGLSSLLLSSPNDASQDPIPNTSEAGRSLVSDAYLRELSGACNGGSNGKMSHYSNVPELCHSGVQMPAYDPFPEICNGSICCTLNTEDPEIPFNNHVLLPNQNLPLPVSFSAQRKHSRPSNLMASSVNSLSDTRKFSGRGPAQAEREWATSGPSHASPQVLVTHVTPAGSQLNPTGDCQIKFDFPGSNSLLMASRDPDAGCGGSGQMSAINLRADGPLTEKLKGKAGISGKEQLGQDLTAVEIPSYGHPQGGINWELTSSSPCQSYQSKPEVGPWNTSGLEPLVNNEEELESDDYVPYSSDVEAMILDMDLVPYDQEYCSKQQVSKYQEEGKIKSIIRLEQGASAYIQRAIAFHGALAILYGRHSKHYIKKPEVLLGRATGELNVDIDLGREGRADKISRRQAIIKMDKGGSFYLMNIGKCLMLVSGKVVSPSQLQKLNSSCLIEIRGMSFIFETNQSRVKQYLDNISEKSQL